MIRLRHKILIRALRLLDLIVLVAAAIGVVYLFPAASSASTLSLPMGGHNRIVDSLGMAMLIVGWIGIFDYFVRYKADRFVGLRAQLKDLLKASIAATFWFLLIGVLFSMRNVSAVSVIGFWASVALVGALLRVSLKWGLMHARRTGYNYRYLLIVGANLRATEMADKIEEKPELGYKLVGFLAEGGSDEVNFRADGRVMEVIGKVDELRSVLENERVDELLVCLSVDSKFSTVTKIIQEARDLGIVLRIVPDKEDGAVLKKSHIEEFEDEFVITFFREQMLLQLLAKRLLDVVASGVGLLLLSPLMVLVAVMIKATSPGPVFFTQDRVGMNQRRFRLFKFRSMVQNAEDLKKDLGHLNEIGGPAFKMENDPRVTSLGRFIRKTSIDELPQLFNVLKGEMSLVGPRPPLPDEVSKYDWLFRRRLSVKPGITCVWQVSGRSNTTFDEWMKMDKQYVENWSLLLDLKILLMTIPAVLLGKGAH